MVKNRFALSPVFWYLSFWLVRKELRKNGLSVRRFTFVSVLYQSFGRTFNRKAVYNTFPSMNKELVNYYIRDSIRLGTLSRVRHGEYYITDSFISLLTSLDNQIQAAMSQPLKWY